MSFPTFAPEDFSQNSAVKVVPDISVKIGQILLAEARTATTTKVAYPDVIVNGQLVFNGDNSESAPSKSDEQYAVFERDMDPIEVLFAGTSCLIDAAAWNGYSSFTVRT